MEGTYTIRFRKTLGPRATARLLTSPRIESGELDIDYVRNRVLQGTMIYMVVRRENASGNKVIRGVVVLEIIQTAIKRILTTSAISRTNSNNWKLEMKHHLENMPNILGIHEIQAINEEGRSGTTADTWIPAKTGITKLLEV